MHSKTKGFIALLLAAIVFSTFGVLIRELDKMFGQFAQVGSRAFVAFVILGFLILWKKESFKIEKSQRLQTFLFALAFPLSIIFSTLSVTTTKAANTVFLLYIGTIFTSLITGGIFFKEKLTAQKSVSLILVIIGLFFFIYPFSNETLNAGFFFGLLSGIFDGISNTLRKLLKNISRNTLLFYQYLLGAVIGISLSVGSGQQFVEQILPISIVILIIYGGLLIVIGNLLIYGFAHFDVNVGTIVLATELFFAIIVNAIFLNEHASQFELFGGILIFIAACLIGINLNDFKQNFNKIFKRL